MSTTKLFTAGSGGQGVLLMGQMVTYAAMLEDKPSTFFPSYGPEMRGGTANCTVVVSDKPVGCPLIYEADAVVVMNLPSLIKFEPLVKPRRAPAEHVDDKSACQNGRILKLTCLSTKLQRNSAALRSATW